MHNIKSGFTLIELLVVVLIIGILAAVALPQYQKAVIKSRFTQLKTIVESIGKAQEIVYLETGSYTLDPQALSISFPQPINTTRTDTSTTLTYEWGSCSFKIGELSCKNGDIGMYYHIYLQHDARTEKRECSADIAQRVSTQICQQETGKTTPFWTGGIGDGHTWAAYAY